MPILDVHLVTKLPQVLKRVFHNNISHFARTLQIMLMLIDFPYRRISIWGAFTLLMQKIYRVIYCMCTALVMTMFITKMQKCLSMNWWNTINNSSSWVIQTGRMVWAKAKELSGILQPCTPSFYKHGVRRVEDNFQFYIKPMPDEEYLPAFIFLWAQLHYCY